MADTSCPTGKVCLWNDASFNLCRFVRDGSDPTFVDNDPCNNGTDFNDLASSAKNRKDHATTLCGDVDYLGGISANLPVNAMIAQLPNNDTASSYKNAVTNCP
jgi:hypothetical protein